MRRHYLHAERIEHERQHVRRSREAVVDDDAESALADRRDVERREQIARVCLPRARGIRDAADVHRRHTTQLAAREVLLDLLLRLRAHLDPGWLEELDADRLVVARAHAHVHAGVIALRLDEMTRDRSRDHAQVGDVDARGRQSRDHRPLDHPARRRALA